MQGQRFYLAQGFSKQASNYKAIPLALPRLPRGITGLRIAVHFLLVT